MCARVFPARLPALGHVHLLRHVLAGKGIRKSAEFQRFIHQHLYIGDSERRWRFCLLEIVEGKSTDNQIIFKKARQNFSLKFI